MGRGKKELCIPLPIIEDEKVKHIKGIHKQKQKFR
jgi:hypothetical protein